jgi:RND superfamily putative drug exporter
MALGLSTRSLASASARHPWRVVVVWVAVLVASFLIAGALLSDALTNEATATNDPDSIKARELVEERLRGPFRVQEAVIVQSGSATVDSPEFRSYVENIRTQVAALGPEVVENVTSFYQSGVQGLVSQDRRTTILPLTMAGDVDHATENIAKVLAIVEEANHQDQFTVYSSGFASIGEDFNRALEQDLQRSEFGTLPIVLVILVLVFGSIAMAFLPLFLAFVAIIAAIALTAIIGQQFQFTFFVTNMIFMMGLAVGIDYSLFIVSRYREERAHGLSRDEAFAVAGSTAGRAVFFSGLTVIVALLGLLIVPQSIFRSLGGGAILVVFTSVAAALTLLPAVLVLAEGFGARWRSWMTSLSRYQALVLVARVIAVPFVAIRFVLRLIGRVVTALFGWFSWDGVARVVMARPVISIVIVTSILVALSIPYFNIQVGFAGVSTLPDSFQSKQGFEILQEEFTGGDVYPAEVVIDGPVNSAPVQGAIERLKTIVSGDPIFGTPHFEVNPAGDLGLLSFQLAADPNSLQATDAIERLRGQYIPEAFSGVDADVIVGGLAAENLDGYDLTTQYLPIVIGFVLALSFLLLMMVFRSIVVPAKAIVMNLLSVGAAYGLIVLIFQEGTGNEVFGFQQVEAIEAWLPLFLFSILFGLSMDYHVFLLSRIRERYDQTGNNTEAVGFGLRSTGRLITGAALIMVAVFGGFALGDLVMFQQMGFGLGVAVLIDATIIRCVLVPASMKLLGRWNWYLPPVLSWLPHIGIDGAAEPARAQEPVPSRS